MHQEVLVVKFHEERDIFNVEVHFISVRVFVVRESEDIRFVSHNSNINQLLLKFRRSVLLIRLVLYPQIKPNLSFLPTHSESDNKQFIRIHKVNVVCLHQYPLAYHSCEFRSFSVCVSEGVGPHDLFRAVEELVDFIGSGVVIHNIK